MAWALRIAKIGLPTGAALTLGWIVLVVLAAIALLWLLFNAEDAFWAGMG